MRTLNYHLKKGFLAILQGLALTPSPPTYAITDVVEDPGAEDIKTVLVSWAVARVTLVAGYCVCRVPEGVTVK
jgi:hypothetical protein